MGSSLLRWPGSSIGPIRPIHTEYSYKYLLADIERLARESGFEVVEHFGDRRGFFVDSLWRVDKV
jgi:uncharacterized SAM-dependent methyltransferase